MPMMPSSIPHLLTATLLLSVYASPVHSAPAFPGSETLSNLATAAKSKLGFGASEVVESTTQSGASGVAKQVDNLPGSPGSSASASALNDLKPANVNTENSLLKDIGTSKNTPVKNNVQTGAEDLPVIHGGPRGVNNEIPPASTAQENLASTSKNTPVQNNVQGGSKALDNEVPSASTPHENLANAPKETPPKFKADVKQNRKAVNQIFAAKPTPFNSEDKFFTTILSTGGFRNTIGRSNNYHLYELGGDGVFRRLNGNVAPPKDSQVIAVNKLDGTTSKFVFNGRTIDPKASGTLDPSIGKKAMAMSGDRLAGQSSTGKKVLVGGTLLGAGAVGGGILATAGTSTTPPNGFGNGGRPGVNDASMDQSPIAGGRNGELNNQAATGQSTGFNADAGNPQWQGQTGSW